jgi:uridine kinase
MEKNSQIQNKEIIEIVKKINDFCLHRYKFIFICGNGGFGKTTLKQQLVMDLHSRDVQSNYIDMDDFLLESTIRKNTQKEWVNTEGIKKSSYLTWAFRESYAIESLEEIISSLTNGSNITRQLPKTNEEITHRTDSLITIIEGVGTAFLNKNDDTFGIFIMCDLEDEIDRRIQRSRDGENTMSREEIRNKALHRNEQFETTILPEKEKFDLELWSLSNYSFRIDKDRFNVL